MLSNPQQLKILAPVELFLCCRQNARDLFIAHRKASQASDVNAVTSAAVLNQHGATALGLCLRGKLVWLRYLQLRLNSQLDRILPIRLHSIV